MTSLPVNAAKKATREGTAAPVPFSYSDDEDEDGWMPFRRSAPDTEKIRVIVEAIRLAEEDVVYDLGCGDGRFIIECCRLTNCSGVGVELDESLLEKATRNASRAPNIRAKFLQRDFVAPGLDLAEATVIFLYLLPEALDMLLPRLRELARTSSALRCIVTLRWALPGVSPSIDNAEMNFFVYRAEDLRSKTESPA
ncbi:uncharacterized protein EMH_0055680 [Eimeria mitis]|uniref:Methyltransferase domain-containing protein n=1 Tax=Eimeria mitis TaxID=44415 RepID=U6K6R3_9EIME|nr:uncharacterized protein EMH_0055680 [Eimeria mitis]CDJ33700.1 hypothetical protein, conserved [Eimeria mitis]